MMLSLLIFFGAWLALRSFGNTGLWGALLVHYTARRRPAGAALSGTAESFV